MIPGLGEGFDIANSIWYFKEGNLTEGVLSLLSGLPIVGSVAVGGVKLFKGGEKAFETAEKIHKACRLISNGATFTRAGSGFIKSGEEIYKNYIKNGKPLDGNFALQAGSMVLNGVTMFFSGKAFIKDFKSMKLVEKMKNVAKKAADSVKADFKTFMKDNRGGVDLSFNGNGKTPANKTTLWGQKKTVTEKGLQNVRDHLSGDFSSEFNDAMINRLENAYKSGNKISGADLDFYAHELYESTWMKKGMDYNSAHEAAKSFYNAKEFNFYHPDVIKQFSAEFNSSWFKFWGLERN